MINTRVPAVPLITNDPYFSLWSMSDRLYDEDTRNWTGRIKPITGIVNVDGKAYRFMGSGNKPAMNQIGLEITPTSSIYTFEAGGVRLAVRFTSPLLLDQLELVSRPCSYIEYTVESIDKKPHNVACSVFFDERHCHDSSNPQLMTGGVHKLDNNTSAWFGLSKQTPLGHSGDIITIDWGYLYLTVPSIFSGTAEYIAAAEDDPYAGLRATIQFADVCNAETAYMVASYDDVLSIMYFDAPRKALWADNGDTIYDVISKSIIEHDDIITRCDALDNEIGNKAIELGGEQYKKLCALSYRQTIAGHKLITDASGKVVFLSKECHSNGCIGTVDVSYPSIPLYLIYQPELVKGMLRPIFKFTRTPVWTYDFAPHDVGRYPYATGQVYGSSEPNEGRQVMQGDVYPLYYQYPANSDIYQHKYQMPVEECGNMLIMTMAAILCDNDTSIAAENLDILGTWVEYLIKYGANPMEQLCTDDFAGHLASNVNLSAKAIMGIEAYSRILYKLGDNLGGEKYHKTAVKMAGQWEKDADSGDHTALTFTDKNSWSLKYNLIWDILFQSGLFSEQVYKNEIAQYKKVKNKYGVPLDSRRAYTKSDWIAWAVAMSDNKNDIVELINPIGLFLEETEDRVPFSDWYDTETAEHYYFRNRTVQGGLFMLILKDKLLNK